jgi:hypothetical protein
MSLAYWRDNREFRHLGGAIMNFQPFYLSLLSEYASLFTRENSLFCL